MGTIEAIFKDSNDVVADSIELNKITWSTKSDDDDIQMFQEIYSVLAGKIVKESQPDDTFAFEIVYQLS